MASPSKTFLGLMARRKTPPKKPEKGENPYQDLLYRKAWALVQETGQSFFEARCEIKLRHPELFKAGFGQSEEVRFVGAAEFEMLDKGVTLDRAYTLAAQALPQEANWMSLRGLR